MEKKYKIKAVVREVLEYVLWFAGVIVAVHIITGYVGVFSLVDGASMEPTLHDREYLWVDKLSYQLHDPERFDIIIFPVEYGGETKHFIKRVIGLPGETVYIDEDGRIYINDEVLSEGYGKEVIAPHTRYLAAQPITLGEDEYFVLGDNRNHSSDSRFEVVGNVSGDIILGKAVFRLWPFNRIGLIE